MAELGVASRYLELQAGLPQPRVRIRSGNRREAGLVLVLHNNRVLGRYNLDDESKGVVFRASNILHAECFLDTVCTRLHSSPRHLKQLRPVSMASTSTPDLNFCYPVDTAKLQNERLSLVPFDVRQSPLPSKDFQGLPLIPSPSLL